MAVDLAVIIVTWNVRDVVLDALKSLITDLSGSSITYDIYIVDSASSDGTVDAIRLNFPHVKIIASTTNLGFAGANNVALRQIGFGTNSNVVLPKAVYLLNPDTITQLGATQILYNALFAEETTGLVGAALTYGDGSFQHSAFAYPGLRQLWVEFFPTPGRLFESSFNGRYKRQQYQAGQSFQVDFVLGATMMLKREVIIGTGMFDEQFFMYCEEVDWAWRINLAGWNVLCVPSAHVIHLGGQSSSQIRPQSLMNLWKSRLLLFDKHYSFRKRIVARVMIQIGLRLKLRALSHSVGLTDEERQAIIHAYNSIMKMTKL